MNQTSSFNRVETLLGRPGSSHSVLLTSFRRNGQGVGTPVGMKAMAGKLYFMTPASSGKVKRLAHTSHVTLALCTFRGQTLGPPVDGAARRLVGHEAKQARKWICAGVAGWIVNAVFTVRYPSDKTAVYEVALLSREQ
ncbi:MAG TPA: PPOX class F420-dependent oxidoreductase [Ktedonobacterales bacterium]